MSKTGLQGYLTQPETDDGAGGCALCRRTHLRAAADPAPFRRAQGIWLSTVALSFHNFAAGLYLSLPLTFILSLPLSLFLPPSSLSLSLSPSLSLSLSFSPSLSSPSLSPLHFSPSLFTYLLLSHLSLSPFLLLSLLSVFLHSSFLSFHLISLWPFTPNLKLGLNQGQYL